MIKFCCDKFTEAVTGSTSLLGAGALYPPRALAAQIELDGEVWNVLGCCGGGCNVLEDIHFCPFCGSKL
jgi:hypothetical protein